MFTSNKLQFSSTQSTGKSPETSKDPSPSRVLINKVDRNYEATPQDLLEQISKIERKLIQQVDFKSGMNDEKPKEYKPTGQSNMTPTSKDHLPSPPYSMIVTPATPQVSISHSSSSNQLSLVKSQTSKPFSMNDDNAQPSRPEPFYLHQTNNYKQPSNNPLPSLHSMPALALETQTTNPNPKNRSRSRSTQSKTKPVRSKSSDEMIECTSLDFYMTDKKYESAEGSSSEKQVRFSMTTIRTPPNSPKPSFDSRYSTSKVMPVPSTNPLVRKKPQSQRNPDHSKNLQQKMETIEDIKANFLERLEVLPESKA